MACRHGDYEGATCAHCGESTPKCRELAERILIELAKESLKPPNSRSTDLQVIERVLEQEAK